MIAHWFRFYVLFTFLFTVVSVTEGADVRPVPTDITGNAATATALAANGTNCINAVALGIDASGNAECTATPVVTSLQGIIGNVAPAAFTGTTVTANTSIASPIYNNVAGNSLTLGTTDGQPVLLKSNGTNRVDLVNNHWIFGSDVDLNWAQSSDPTDTIDTAISRVAAGKVGVPALVMTVPANTVGLSSTGYSVTGSGTNSAASWTGTLNTSGGVHVNDWSITDTAHGSGSTLFRIRGGAGGVTDNFAVFPDGVVQIAGAADTANLGRLVFGTNSSNRFIQGNAGNIEIGAALTDLTFASSTSAWRTAASSITTASAAAISTTSSFTPASGSGSWALAHLNPTINGTSSGTAYGLLLASKTNTLTGGTIKLASFGTTTTNGFTGYTEKLGVLTDGTMTSAGHLQTSTTAPAVSNTSANSCGTTAATIVGTDANGSITIGSVGGTSCTVTFTTTWTNRPQCFANNSTTANLARTTSTTTDVIIAGTFVAGDVVDYWCVGRV